MERLSKREIEIADLIHQGYIEKEISNKLFIAPSTVHTHNKNIKRKIGARNAADITRIFLTKLKQNAIIIIVALITAYYFFKQEPELLELIKTSLINSLK